MDQNFSGFCAFFKEFSKKAKEVKIEKKMWIYVKSG
jgi:hypothetical protein